MVMVMDGAIVKANDDAVSLLLLFLCLYNYMINDVVHKQPISATFSRIKLQSGQVETHH